MAPPVSKPGESGPFFETADLNLASFLRCRGFVIEGLENRHFRMVFAFRDSPELHRTVLDFANDGAVGVRSFCNTVRDLKGLARPAGDLDRSKARGRF